MSVLTYTASVSPKDKPLAWLHGQVKTPPFSMAARIETGFSAQARAAGREAEHAAVATDAIDRGSMP